MDKLTEAVFKLEETEKCLQEFSAYELNLKKPNDYFVFLRHTAGMHIKQAMSRIQEIRKIKGGLK